MITAAIISFGILALAWIFAPGERATTAEPMAERRQEPLPEAA